MNSHSVVGVFSRLPPKKTSFLHGLITPVVWDHDVSPALGVL